MTNTLFDLPDVVEPETIITRYVVKVIDLIDGDESYYRHLYTRDEYGDSTQFVAIEEPIKIRGMKLPKMHRSHTQAQNRVTDLYNRHKKGGEGIRIVVEKWTRKPDENEWRRVAS